MDGRFPSYDLSPICFHRVCLSAGWFATRIEQKNTAWISIKLGWRISLSPEWTPSTFDADPGKREGNIVRSGFKLAGSYE